MNKLAVWWTLHGHLLSPFYHIRYHRNRRKSKKHLDQFTPGQTFVQGCDTDAMLVTEVDYNAGLLIGTDLITGEERHIDAHYCLDGEIPWETAFVIALLGDTYKEQTEIAYNLIGSDDNDFYDMTPERIMEEMAKIRAEDEQ